MGQRICSVDGCGKPFLARGWCRKHYQRWWSENQLSCCLDGCLKPATSSQGWCSMHFTRWRRYGDVDRATAEPVPLFERWASKVSGCDDPEECWEWQAAKRNGYGVLRVGGRDGWNLPAHRFAYEHFVGPVPEGMLIDHRCLNPGCANPSHLRLATKKQNAEHLNPNPHNTSGFRGVGWDERAGRWRTYATHNGAWHSAGHYDTAEEANAAVTALRNRLFTHNDLDRREKPHGRKGSPSQPRVASQHQRQTGSSHP